MDVQELYDYALKHGVTGEPIHIHVLDDDKHLQFISEHLDLVDFQVDSDETNACLRIWVKQDKAAYKGNIVTYAGELGEWICNQALHDINMVKCSKCNTEFYKDELEAVGDVLGFVNFCPRCGARMSNIELTKTDEDIGD
jgi:hypothetical protein